MPNDDSWVDDLVKYRDYMRAITDAFLSGRTTWKEADKAYKKAYKELKKGKESMVWDMNKGILTYESSRKDGNAIEKVTESDVAELLDTFERLRKIRPIKTAESFENEEDPNFKPVSHGDLGYKTTFDYGFEVEKTESPEGIDSYVSIPTFDFDSKIVVSIRRSNKNYIFQCTEAHRSKDGDLLLFSLIYKKDGEKVLSTKLTIKECDFESFTVVTFHDNGQEKTN